MSGPVAGGHVDELLGRCLVRLGAPGASGGTGFFVAPGTILTCAHAVAGASGGSVEVDLGTRTVAGVVAGVHPPTGGIGMYPYPDLAVVTVDETCGHGIVVLDEGLPLLDDRLHAVGFSSTLGGRSGAEPATYTFDGLHPTDDGMLLKLGAGAHASAGMSGAPLLNLRTGRVCGIVKTTRDNEHPYGGWAVPVRALRAYEPELLVTSAGFHERDRAWAAAFTEAVGVDPAPAGPHALPPGLEALLGPTPALRQACVALIAAYQDRLGADGGRQFRDRLHRLLALAVAHAAPEALGTLGGRDAALLTRAGAHVASCEAMPAVDLARLVAADAVLRRLWYRHVDRTRRLTARTWERVSGLPGGNLPDPRALGRLTSDLGPAEQAAVSLFLETELSEVAAAAFRHPAGGSGDATGQGRLGAASNGAEPFAGCDALAGLVVTTLAEPLRVLVARCVERFEGVRAVAGTRPLYVGVLLRTALTARRLLDAGPDGDLTPVSSPNTPDHRLRRLQQLVVDVQPESEIDGETLRLVVTPDSPSTVQTMLGEIDRLREVVDHGTATLAQYHVAGREAGLRLRHPRIRSSVDDPAHYVRSHRFDFESTPGQITLNVANVLPLLVRPLYGDRPEVGVRELLQNALDAVWARRGLAEPGTAEASSGEVRIAVSDGSGARGPVPPAPGSTPAAPAHWTHWLEVRDDGVGMTTDVVREHFLSVGGSYDPAEDARLRAGGRPGAPLRIGRFGVGVLAGFLLGAEIQVITRHVAAEEAVHFVMREDTELVELYRCAAPVGTTVRVQLTPARYDRLLREPGGWDWYHFLDPPATRTVVREGAATALASSGPPLDPSDDLVWRRLEVTGYGEVFWTPSEESYRGRIYVNGIRVAAPHRNFDRNLMQPVSQLKQPVVSIADHAGACALNLTRDRFVEYPQPVLDEVRRDALRDQVAWYAGLAAAGPDQLVGWESPLWECRLYNAGEGDGVVHGVPYVVSHSHVAALVPALLAEAGFEEVYFLLFSGSIRTREESELPDRRARRVADLARLARALGAPVGMMKVDMFGGFGYNPLAAGTSETFRFGSWSAAASSLSQLVTVARGEAYAAMHPESLVGQDDGWMQLSLRSGSDTGGPPDLLTDVDRNLVTELGGYGVLRVVPTGKPFRPEETAEFVQMWQEFGLPAALPLGVDVGDCSASAADELRVRISRVRRPD
ncbi:trypsin-like peptidase domain-containing protein [Micromonospora citrea]|nr:trypsin-like peptidase domain-containing protein [Micromonospora citrea]